ncbi:MAG: sugar-phosphatase [Lactobacillales bacterium]|jgi:Cof subfamily protein (haloacid dehalogenase superfamily)|nr:sugar-phosphatase [Lactobacillales bacterium]
MAYKLIAVDLDGTLFDDNKKVTPRVKRAIAAARAAGLHVVLATGRPLPGVSPLLKELDYAPEDFVICYNGSLVQTVGGEILKKVGMNKDEYLKLYEAVHATGAHFHVNAIDGLYTSDRDVSLYTTWESFHVGLQIKYRTPEEIIADEHIDIIKVMMIDEEAVVDASIPQLPAWVHTEFTTLRTEDFFYEFINRAAGKGTAVAAVAEKLGIKQDEVIAIGDSENDRSMIEWAGLGVAMGNARPELKPFADLIAPSNVEDGLAYIIEEYMLKTTA